MYMKQIVRYKLNFVLLPQLSRVRLRIAISFISSSRSICIQSETAGGDLQTSPIETHMAAITLKYVFYYFHTVAYLY